MPDDCIQRRGAYGPSARTKLEGPNNMLIGARDTACKPTPSQANHSCFLASARTKVGRLIFHIAQVVRDLPWKRLRGSAR